MMRATLVLSILYLVQSVVSSHAQHEWLDDRSPWIKRDPVSSTFLLPMRIGLSQANLQQGQELLMGVSDPTSSSYGQYLRMEDVHTLFAPSAGSIATVTAWLSESGIPVDHITQSANKQWLQFDAEAHEAEKLLQTKFHFYEHSITGKTSIGCDEYYVKGDVQQYIDYITPCVQMLGFVRYTLDTDSRRSNIWSKRHSSTMSSETPNNKALTESLRDELFEDIVQPKHCNKRMTPACIMALYKIPPASTAVKGNELGIFEETTQWLDQEDLDLFFTHFAPRIPNGTYPVIHDIDGARNRNVTIEAGNEAVLEMEIAFPLLYPQEPVMFLTDSYYEATHFNHSGWFNTFLDAIDGSYCSYSAFGETGDNNTVDPTYPSKGYRHKLECGVFKPTNVISFSYELAEFKEGTTENYQRRQCNEYMKLGLQGVSVVFSSGDAGVGSPWGCSKGERHQVFNPNFPANCPYVTAVGGTWFHGNVERASTIYPSGGGFSNYFARPSYQDDAVTSYFKLPQAAEYSYYTGSDFGSGYYNRSGRGIPDISAVAQSIVNFGRGNPYLTGGTSASAPIFASILTRINEERLRAGMPTVGFVNPLLYRNPQAFRDVTIGDNPGCGTKGFSAAPGWNPITGLGTPDYPALLAAFMDVSRP